MTSEALNTTNFDDFMERIAKDMEWLLAELPETLSLDDLKHHDGLRRLVIAADDFSNRVDRRALSWAKSQ